jgi:uncharacterized protein Usg
LHHFSVELYATQVPPLLHELGWQSFTLARQFVCLKSFVPHWHTYPVGELGASMHKFGKQGLAAHFDPLVSAVVKVKLIN